MKKLMITLLAVTLVAPAAFANPKKKAAPKAAPASFERNYGTAGCGLGSMALGKSGGFMQVFAATTNGTSANQLFGITSGTLNCLDGPAEEVASRMDNFIEINKVALASDIAQGQGEALNAFASLMGCSSTGALGKTLQNNFEVIYPSHTVQTMDVTDKVITIIKNDSELYNTCSSIQVI